MTRRTKATFTSPPLSVRACEDGKAYKNVVETLRSSNSVPMFPPYILRPYSPFVSTFLAKAIYTRPYSSPTAMQPLTVWGHWGAPNPWKVRTILEELEIPHEWREIELNEVKSEEYLKVTPNGRLPAIEDPNTGVTLWEVNSAQTLPIFLSLERTFG